MSDQNITININGNGVKINKDPHAALQEFAPTGLAAAMAAKNERRPDPINMIDVQSKVRTFQLKMQQIADVIDGTQGVDHLKILDRDKFFTHFIIDKAAVSRLNAIATQTDFKFFSVFFGLEDPDTKEPQKDPNAAGLGQLTCCFVGMDADCLPLINHFPPTPARPFQIRAEETWPPPPRPAGPVNLFTLNDTPDRVATFFANRP